MNRTLEQLNLQHNTMIKVNLGRSGLEGQYEIKIYEIKLRDGLPDSQIFTKESLGTISVQVGHTGKEIRAVVSSMVEGEFMLRNPNYDIGQVIQDTDRVENLFFFDGKEVYVQKVCHRFVPYLGKTEVLQILVREWHPDTWSLSEIKLIEFPKKAKTFEFAQYLQSMYPHIEPSNFWACRVAVMRGFFRSDLCLKKWS